MKLPLKIPRNYIDHSKNSFNVRIWALDLGHFITGFKLFFSLFWLAWRNMSPNVYHKAGKICARLTTKQAKSALTLCPPQSRQNLHAPYVHHKAGKICARLMSTTRTVKISVRQMSTTKQAKSASTTEQAISARALCPPQSRQILRAPYIIHKAGKICAQRMSTTKQAKCARALCPPQSKQILRATNIHHKAGKICARRMFTTKQAKSACALCPPQVSSFLHFEPKMKLCH